MDTCFYNGVELGPIPSGILSGYKYLAIIKRNGYGDPDYYILVYCDAPLYQYTDPNGEKCCAQFSGATQRIGYYCIDPDYVNYGDYVNSTIKDGDWNVWTYGRGVVWANHDIFAATGTITSSGNLTNMKPTDQLVLAASGVGSGGTDIEIVLENVPDMMIPGSEHFIDYSVNGTGEFDKGVTVAISGGISTETHADVTPDGQIHVNIGDDEQTESITLTVTSVADTSVSVTVNIPIRPEGVGLSGIQIVLSNFPEQPMPTGSEWFIDYYVTGPEELSKEITAYISDNTSPKSGVNVGPDQICVYLGYLDENAESITLTVKSVADPTAVYTYTIDIYQSGFPEDFDPENPGGSGGSGDGGDSGGDSGGSGGGSGGSDSGGSGSGGGTTPEVALAIKEAYLAGLATGLALYSVNA